MPDNNLNLVARNRAEISGMMSTIPQVPVSQYDDMLASAVSPGKPDSYGPLKWLTDVSNRWSYNQTESKKKSDEGDLMLNIEPEIASIKNRLETIKEVDNLANTIGQIDSVLSNTTDPVKQTELLTQRDSLSAKANELEVRQLQYQKDRLSKAAEELEKVKLRLKDRPAYEVTLTDEYKRFNELYREVYNLSSGNKKDVVADLGNRLNELYSLRDVKTNQINEYNSEMEKYNSKISRYYNAVEQSNEGAIDFGDINTYLYKLPGLHGSSSAQILEQTATTAATVLLTGGAKLAASGATKAAQLLGAGTKTAGAIGSTVGAAVKGGGALAAITGNLYTRDKESMMEVFTNYETSVKEKLDSKGLSLDPYIAKARTNKKYANLSDENIVSKILTGEIKTNDKNIDTILEDSKLGLSQLYKDNMMLSISDVAQDYIMAMPWSKLLSKAAISTSSVSNPLKRKLSDFVAFGLEKTPQSLGKLTNRKIAGSFAKRTGTSAFLEGTEEGVQYIKGQDYVDEKHYGQEPSYFRAAINDISAAGKSTFGILGAAASYFGIPVKSELANDAEFIKNWKGGALLGGLMTGVVTGASSIVEYNKAASGNNIVMQLTADQLTAKDNMVKAKMYAERAVSGKQASVINALNSLKDIMPEGMTEQDINEEISRANSVMSIANSDVMTNFASNLSITPNDEDYGILIGLHLNATERYNNIKDNKHAAALDYTKTVHKPEIQQGFTEAYGDKSQDAIYASKLKTQLDTVNEMIDQINDDLSNMDVLYNEYGIKIDKANAKVYLSELENVKDFLENEYNANKDVLGDGGVLAYSQAEPDIKKAYAKHLLMELAEEDAMDDYLLLSGFAKDTDNKYKPISQLDEDAKSKALKRVLRDIEKYKGVMVEDAAIAAETQLNEIININNSIEDEVEVTPSEEAFVETAQEEKQEEQPVEEMPVIETTEIPTTEPEIVEQPQEEAQPIVQETATEVNVPTFTKDGVRFNVDGTTVTIDDIYSFSAITRFETEMGSPVYNEAVNKMKAAFHDKGYDVQIEPNFETGQVDYKIKKLETTPTNKPTDDTKDDDVDLWADAGIAFRTQIEEAASALNPIKAKRYLLRILGLKDDQVEILDTVITLAKSGIQLAGATKADSIILWKGAEVGTEYHEAWHRVSLLLLPTETREKIYKAYRKRYNKNLSDKSLEELLGEEFRLFTIANERSGITESNNFFSKVWNYIKILATSRDRKLHKLFLDINYGKYSNVKVNQESLAKFREIYGEEGAPFRLPGGVNFDNIPFYNNYLNIVSALRALTFTANGITTADDLTSISFVKVKKALEQLVKSPKITDTQRKVLTEVLDKFESHFVQAIKDSLSQMFIRVIDETENDTRSQLDSGDLGNDIASHILDSIEVSRKDNIAGSVKIFFSTIPSVKFVNNEQVAVVDSNSGLPIFENGDIVLKTMFSDLHNIKSVDDLYERVAKLAKTSPMYAAIYNRLQSPNVRNNENLLTQIEISIRSHVHNYIDARVSKEIDDKGNTITSFIIDDAAGNNMVKRYPIMWGVTFVNNNLDYNTNTKSFELNEANLKDAVDEFNYMSTILVASMYDSSYITNNKYGDISTVEGLTNMKSKLLSTLAKIGIVMDMVSLNDMLTDPMYADENPLQAFRHFVSYSNAELSNGLYRTTLVTIFKNTISGIIKNKGKFIKNINKGKSSKEIQGELYDLYKNERVINTMSKYYTKNNQTSEDLSVIGANGNLLYPISQNNFMSDFTNWLNNDSELVKKLESVSYIGGSNKRGSLILNSLRNGLKLKLNTFISFREEGTKDKGRDYFDISPVEDYLIKMAMVNKDHIILPTMADKKRYHTITGIPLTHDRIRLEASSLNPNAMVVKFSEETLTRFVDYMLAEIDAVEDGIKQSEELSTYEKVANYHIGQKNATYFRVFNGVYITKDGKETFVNFNDPSNSQKFNLQVAKDLFVGTKEAPVSFDTQLAYMNRLLNEMMKAELKKAKDLGIISMDDSIRSAKNNLLDPARFKATLQQYKESANDVIKNNAESLAVYDMIADFAINTVISIIEFEKVFSGDPAYYKWGRDKEGNITDPTIDKIKRLGGLLSTGENMRLEWPEGHPLYGKTTYTVSEINDNMVYSEQVAELRKLFTRGNFKDLLINKLKLSEQEAEKIAADPTSFKDKRYAKIYKEAEAIADSDVKEYDYDETKRSGNINEADATCFISPTMLRHIVEASDEWTPEIAEAYRILEETDDWRSNPDLYFKAMKASLKALKYMSFGFNFDERNSLAIPFFNKMAIFPLMKGLATGDNKVLYDRMNDTEKPVDMVIFNSAVKVGGRQRFSFYKDTHNKEINDLSDIPVYTQEYKYLRKQLVTDPHHHDDASLGTQVAKGVISNIVPEREYTDYNTGKIVTGKELIDNIFGSMNALSNKGKNRIIEKFGAVYDSVSKAYDLNKKIFSKLIEGDAKSSNMNINVLDGISIDEETGTFNIPLSALSDNQWLEERTLSLVTDETVDIHTPGGSFIQMSSFAFKASDGTIVSEHTYNKGNKLKLVNKDGSMDAIISIAMFADIIPNYDRLTFDEAKQYLIDNNVIGEKAKANSIGYRIPTQGLASISALRFVDVLPKNYGDMIVLPDAFTKLTGSDFDIDKLYVARYTYDAVKRDVKERFHVQATDKDIAKAFIGYNEWFNEVLGVDANKQPITRAAGYKKNKLDSYNDYLKATKSKVRYDAATDTYDYSWTIRDIVPTPFNDALGFEGNSDKANVNKLLSSYITILTQTNNQHELKKSIDTATDKVKGILKIIKRGKVSRTNQPFKFYAPAYQLEKKIEYTSSKKGIGPFALNNVHHALTQAFKVKFRASSDTALLQQYGMLDLDSIYDKSTMDKVLDWLSAMINAFVDIAKDPYIVESNIGNWTYNMTNLFLRTGMGETTFYFMPQPILKEIANSVDALSGMYGIDKTKSKTKLEREAINKILDDYKKKAADSVGLPINEYEDKYEVNTPLGSINKEELLNSIHTPENERNVAWYTYQLRVYSTFNNLKVYADALAEFVNISQVDTKKFGNSLITQSIFKRKYDEFMRSRSSLFTDELKDLINKSFIATKLNNSINFSKALFSSLMFRNTSRFSNILSIVGRLTDNYYGLTVDQAKRISRAIEGKVKSEVFRDIMTPTKFRQLFFGTNTVAKRLMMLKADIMDGKYPELLSDTGKINNELINFIVAQPVIDQVNTDPEFITVNNNIYDKALTNNLIIFWEELLNSEHATIREFAEDLALYAFFTSADNAGANALFKYVPNSWRKSSGYAKAMAEIDEQFLNETYSFDADELFLNNWHNEEIVPTIQFAEDRGMTIIDNQQIRDIRELPHIKSSVKHPTYDKNYPILFINNRPFSTRASYVKIKIDKSNNSDSVLLYKNIGSIFDENGNAQPVYQLVQKRGFKQGSNTLYEYGSNMTYIASNLVEVINDFSVDGIISYIKSHTEAYNKFNNDSIIEDLSTFIPNTDINKTINDEINKNESSSDNIIVEGKQTESEIKKGFEIVSAKKPYNREEVREDSSTLYIFTDNTDRTSGTNPNVGGWYAAKYGSGLSYGSANNPTTAVIRGLDNAYPISTMKWFYRNHNVSVNDARWTDDDIEEFKKVIDDELSDIKDAITREGYTKVVIPAGDGFFNSKIANISEVRTPKLYAYLKEKVAELNALANSSTSSALVEDVQTIEETFATTQSFNIEEATLHSGGAIGADSMWDAIGSAFGLKKKRHYYHGEKTPAGNIEISAEDYQEGREKSAQAAKAVWGYQYPYMKDDRLIRNWAQVKYSDAIFAVSTIINPGENVFPNQPKDTRIALKQAVSGGTGYAVEMAIQAGKPVYVFNQKDNKWYTWDENSSEFVQIPIPKLTNNFAGIGTRQISAEGKQAIHDVYANSIVAESSKQTANEPTIDEPTINVYAGTNDNTNLSNFAKRSFKVIDTIFTSVEQAFQYYKALYANDSETASKILSTNSAATARSLGRSVKNLDIKSWDKISSDILKNLMYESFAQNEDAKNELLSTGNKTITHQYKGVEQDNGRFSKLLMSVRDELSKVKKSTPEAAPIKQESSLSYKNSGRSTLSGEPNLVVINGVTLDLSEIGIQFQLGEQQMEALNKIAKWLQNKKDKSNFTLVGYAGTGKTTIMKVLLHYLNVAKAKSGVRDYQLAAPTHKASGVLSKNVGERAMTLAKLLSIKPAINEVTGRVEFGQNGKHAVRPGSLVIVDEFSLINDDTVDILENTVRYNGGKVLYLGDDAQLFPVGQNTISKALKQDNVYKLTDIKRQTGNNPLIRWLQYIRDNATVNGYSMKHSTNITINNDGRMYIPGSKSQDWLNTAAKLFNSDSYKNDADFVKILAFTNKAVNLYNYLIRLSMGYESLNNIHIGETLTAYNTLTDPDGKEMGIYNSSDYRVIESESVDSKVSNMYFDLYTLTNMDANIKPVKLTVRNTMESEEDANEISLYILTNEDKKVMSDILRTAFLNTKKKVSSYYAMASNGEITRASASKESAMAWKMYYNAVESVFTMFDVTDETGKVVYKEKSMDFGYASTIHKSQGSTYTYAFVDDSDIATAEYNSVQMASQLRYVGMSRPKKAAIALTNYNIDGVAGVETSHMTLEYFENNIDRMNNESDDTAIKTCK